MGKNNANENAINTGAMTNGEFTVSYQTNGNGGCIPVIDGTPCNALMFGYTSETDRKGGLKLIEQAIRATKGNVYEAKRYIMNAMMVAANDIKPDEAIDVDGVEILVVYTEGKAYIGTEEIANLDDLECSLPNEAVRELLKARAKNVIEERRQAESYQCNDEPWDDDEDEEYEWQW